MTKRQLIDVIVSINRSATPTFLAEFDRGQLDEYLRHLQWGHSPRLSGDPHRFDHYFDKCPTVAVAEPALEALRLEDESTSVGLMDENNSEELPSVLDLNTSESAFFNESYDTPEEDRLQDLLIDPRPQPETPQVENVPLDFDLEDDEPERELKPGQTEDPSALEDTQEETEEETEAWLF